MSPEVKPSKKQKEVPLRWRWESFSRRAQRVINGILEEIATPTIDTDPQAAEERVRRLTDFLDEVDSTYIRCPNKVLVDRLLWKSEEADAIGDERLANEFDALVVALGALSRSQRLSSTKSI